MPTARHFTRRAYQCSLYEAQDVLLAIDGVHLIALEPGAGFRLREALQRKLVYRDRTRRLVFMNPGLKRVRLTRDYDLFMAVCQNHWDLLYFNAIEGWKDRCRTSVCWLDEMWAADIPLYHGWLRAFEQFDHVFVGGRGTVVPLSETIGKACHWLPGAVDTIRFSPYPNPPARVIDVYSVGRRWEALHRVLVEAAARREMFYVHDTFPSMANMEPYDPVQHRELFANLAKRSRFFMVAPGKIEREEETQGQVEIGYRFYEGAAAGAVMLGQPPECAAFRETFDWPDPVIPVKSDGSDLLPVLRELRANPGRLSAIGTRNAAEALRRHDWVHRWKEILRVADLELTPELVARERQLKQMADSAMDADGAPSAEPLP